MAYGRVVRLLAAGVQSSKRHRHLGLRRWPHRPFITCPAVEHDQHRVRDKVQVNVSRTYK
jgi:hypothetical protein